MKPSTRCLALIAAALFATGAAGIQATPDMGTAAFCVWQSGIVLGSGSLPSPTPEKKALTLEQRADIFMARKDYEQAADYYTQALQHTPKDPLIWNKLGIAFQQLSKFASARKAYSNAFHLDKNFAEAWNNLGTVYFMQKKYGKTVKYYRRAIELKSDNASFHINLGTSYYHLKRFPQAVEEYRTALGIDPNVLTEQSPLGTVVHAGGADVEFYYYLAKAFASVGNAEQAVRYLRRALEDGFKDSKRIDEDPDFKKISQYPAFVELMRNPPVAIKD
jgi:tetratricopeptide (TPR) repeat protein